MSFTSLGGAFTFSISNSSLLGTANDCDEKIDMLQDSKNAVRIKSLRIGFS
jgi:hypothetical protein